jgi:hypothetical protein
MKIRHWLPILVAVLAGGCAGNVRLTQQEISPVYTASEFSYAGADRDLRVDIVGNPFGGDQRQFDSIITGYMQGSHWGPPTHFTTTPNSSAREAYRVVMLFDPPSTFPGIRICREKPQDLPTQADASKIILFSAFCRGNESLTEIKGRIEAASGPDDPKFGDLVASVTNGLFPPRRRFEDDRDCWYRWHCL